MLNLLKSTVLGCAKGVGLFHLTRRTGWRNRRLLILCYHGISIRDEHKWNPGLYMQLTKFRQRMQALREGNYCVLPLGEGIRRLYAGDLPERSVSITFDDGFHDFCLNALPILQEYGFPTTVYLTTYYTKCPVPIFNLVLSYLLWKGEGRTLSATDTGLPMPLDLRNPAARRVLVGETNCYVEKVKMSWRDKNDVARRIAGLIGVDYDRILAERLLQLMNPQELAAIASAGVDVQLHTHRHRSPLQEEAFAREVRENREHISAITNQVPVHFCYPSGQLSAQYPAWLKKCSVESATTCELGFATSSHEPFLLPRLLDNDSMHQLVFESWLSGLGMLLPRRV